MGKMTKVSFKGDWRVAPLATACLHRLEHYRLYIVDFEDGAVKVGITRDLRSRVETLITTRRGLNLPASPKHIAFSAPHRDARRSEQALLDHHGFRRLGGEYIDASYEDACAAAEELSTMPNVNGTGATYQPARSSADIERRAENAERRLAEARERATLDHLDRLEAKLDRLGEAVAALSARFDAAPHGRGLCATVATAPAHPADTDGAADVLHGYVEIGTYMRISKDQAKHRAVAGELPTFKLGRKVCARRSTLINWMQSQEIVRNG